MHHLRRSLPSRLRATAARPAHAVRLLALFAALPLLGHARSIPQTHYIGGDLGAWNDALSWTNGVPTASVDAYIDSGHPIHSGAAASSATLRITSSTFEMLNGATLQSSAAFLTPADTLTFRLLDVGTSWHVTGELRLTTIDTGVATTLEVRNGAHLRVDGPLNLNSVSGSATLVLSNPFHEPTLGTLQAASVNGQGDESYLRFIFDSPAAPYRFTATGDATAPDTQITGTTQVSVEGGTVILGGVNTYTGRTHIGSGSTLRAAGPDALPDGNRYDVNGTLDLQGHDLTMNGLANFDFEDSDAEILNDGTLTIYSDGTQPTRFGGTIRGTGTLITTGSSGLNLSGTGIHTFSVLEHREGFFQLRNAEVDTLTVGGHSTNAALFLNENGTVTVGGGVGTLNIQSDATYFAGVVIDSDRRGSPAIIQAANIHGTGPNSVLVFQHRSSDYHLTQDGTASGTPVLLTGTTVLNSVFGTTTLYGAHTHTGGTIVGLPSGAGGGSGTTLIVEGSIGDVTVQGDSFTTEIAHGTLGGNGTVGAITLLENGIIAPGIADEPGVLHATSLTWHEGAILRFDLGFDEPGSSDQLVLSGALTGEPSATQFLFLFDHRGGEEGQTYDLITADSTDIPVELFGIHPDSAYSEGFFTYSGTTLQFTIAPAAIPEPATAAALLGFGVLGLAATRRRPAARQG